MKTRRYQFRISGLHEAEGRIRAFTLCRVLDALRATAERTTRLLATGSGGGKGARARWLSDTIDFTITALRPGSTVFDIEAPRLRETARDQFAQADPWGVTADLDDTALDLAARSIAEIKVKNPVGNYFDSSVLDAILMFRSAADSSGARYEMTPRGAARGRFALDDATWACARDRLDNIPVPRAFVVSGRLDEIRHGNGHFRLLVNSGAALPGRLDAASLNVEALRSLWGKETTVEGMVHFKPNGQPRFIKARQISSRRDGDGVFEEAPSAEIRRQTTLLPVRRGPSGAFDPADLAGAWPGDEPIEELLAQLD